MVLLYACLGSLTMAARLDIGLVHELVEQAPHVGSIAQGVAELDDIGDCKGTGEGA